MHGIMFFGVVLVAIVVGLCGLANCCVTFYCINACGTSSNSNGYKLILANNRDEDIRRPTIPANVWPVSEKFPTKKQVYGALDVLRGYAPAVYSTWLAINEYGNVGNLLFYREKQAVTNVTFDNRGIIVPNYMHKNSKNYDTLSYLDDLDKTKFNFKGTNLVLLEMSELTGNYSIYYMNNTSTERYRKLNDNENRRFIFGVSNSEPEKPFRKVVEGELMFASFIDEYSKTLDKEKLIDSLMNKLLLNNTPFYPDENLANSMGLNISEANRYLISNISAINANYLTSWPFARTRTSTLMLIDQQDNVEYYELNLTVTPNRMETWVYNNLSFNLNPLYKSVANIQNSVVVVTWLCAFTCFILIREIC